ncbi:MAG: hypothetical protein K8T26_15700 [Lentisphaerae bacterium]|nr:hypothetical protein [Lentisphaerota bacterium]
MQTRAHIPTGRLILFLTAGLTVATALAGDINVGDPAERVRTVLGEPRGHIRSGTYELLQYDRGRVEVRDGVVTQVTLVSAEEAATLKIEREQQYREAQARQAAKREQRRVEGLAARDRALANPDFLASSGERQVEYWSSFRGQYPDVPVDSEYAAALAKRDRERQEAETQQRLAAMEQRVSEAEQRARDAEQNAEEARRNAERRYVYVAPPYYRYPTPYCPPVPPQTNRTAWQPTYPATGWNADLPYTHGYTSWASPHYVVRPSSVCTPPPRPSPGMRVSVNF